MKIRSDFVTNSSSSSFILARKSELTEAQKEAIIKYVENSMFGKKIAGTKEQLDEYFKKEYGCDYSDFSFNSPEEKEYERPYYFEQYKKALKAIENGMAIFSGTVSFEFENEYAYVLKEIWGDLEDADPDSFIGIDTDLDY